MKRKSPASPFLAFLAAVVLAVVWGAIVQTQFNLAGLKEVGAEIPASLQLQATFADLFSGFSPTYGGYIVIPALIIAFGVAKRIANVRLGSRLVWFGVAGGLAILAGIPLVNYLSPVALLVGATRDWACTILMALGGGAAGLLFAWMSTPRSESRELGHGVATA